MKVFCDYCSWHRYVGDLPDKDCWFDAEPDKDNFYKCPVCKGKHDGDLIDNATI